MATSSSINLNFTARELINYALRKINIVAQTEEASGDDADRALMELNLMLKGWMRYEHLWRRHEGYVTVIADTKGYTLTPRPYRIYDVRYRNSSLVDLPMIQLTKEEYYELPLKGTNGIPTQWFFDPQRDSDSLFVWPVLLAVDGTTPETLRVSYQRRFEDVDTLAENVDIPQQYFDVVANNLAARLADSYGRSGGHIDRIIQRAEILKQEMQDDDREAYVQFVPDPRYYGR